MKISLRFTLIISFILLITVSVGLVTTSSYYSTKNIMEDHVRNIMYNISSFALDKSKTYMQIAKEAAQLTKRLENVNVVTSGNKDAMEQYFKEQLSLHNQFSSIYYANNKGEFIMVFRKNGHYVTKKILKQNDIRVVTLKNNDNKNKINILTNDSYDPRIRPWYKLALKSSGISWTDPYVFFTSQKVGITASVPLHSSSNVNAVIGVDIGLNELSNFISDIKISVNSKVFILDNNLQVISFPNTNSVVKDKTKKNTRLMKLNELNDKIAIFSYNQLKNTLSSNKFKERKFVKFEADDKNTYYALYLPFKINNINWIIGMYVPENDYLGLIKKNQNFNIMLSILIGIFAIIGGYFIAKQISKPIGRMQNMAHDLHDLNLNIPYVKPSNFEEIDEAIDSFNIMKDSLKIAYSDTIYRLAVASEYKDMDTAKHIKRIGKYSVIIGTYLKLDEEQLYLLENASLMHDIGKLGISDDILLKADSLTKDERIIMEQHSQIGANILEHPTSDIMKHGREVALYHHERWDGRGYPSKLKGDKIPLFARIVAIADVFDAVVSKRCYKDAMSLDYAKEIIVNGSGQHFDPMCVEAFINSFEQIIEVYEEYKE